MFKKLKDIAIMPKKAHSSDAGWDLFTTDLEFVPHGKTIVVDTGVSIDIPEGYFGLIADKSSIASKGLKVCGGIVDSGYKGELKVVLANISNTSDDYFVDEISRECGYTHPYGKAIAQIILIPCLCGKDDGSRGVGGFGSSGL